MVGSWPSLFSVLLKDAHTASRTAGPEFQEQNDSKASGGQNATWGRAPRVSCQMDELGKGLRQPPNFPNMLEEASFRESLLLGK